MISKRFVIVYNVWRRNEPSISLSDEKILVSGVDERSAIKKFKSLHAPTCQVLEAFESISD